MLTPDQKRAARIYLAERVLAHLQDGADEINAAAEAITDLTKHIVDDDPNPIAWLDVLDVLDEETARRN